LRAVDHPRRFFLRHRRKRNELEGFTSCEHIKDTVRSFDGGLIKRMKKAGFGLHDRKAAYLFLLYAVAGLLTPAPQYALPSWIEM
jgi:hypothetical protein